MIIAVPVHSYINSSKFKYFFFENESDLLLDIKENLEFNLSEFTTKFKLTDECEFMQYSQKAPISQTHINNYGYSEVSTKVHNSVRKPIVNLCLLITEDSFHFEGTVDGIEYYSDIINLDSLNKIIEHGKVLQSF